MSFKRETSKFICSCHLFKFWDIVCRHVITILIPNDVKKLPEYYTLRRWRRDVSRAYKRVAVNHNGLVSTPKQLRYDSMCQAFAQVADLDADDQCRTRLILDLIKIQVNELMSTKLCSASSIISKLTIHLSSQYSPSQTNTINSIRDLNIAKKKGAPRRLQRKSPLESKKLGVCSSFHVSILQQPWICTVISFYCTRNQVQW